jgi:hypothetical protein
MRFFKLNAALLALIFSVIAEVLFLVIDRIFGHVSEFGSPLNFIGWLIYWFHELPGAYLPGILGDSPLALPAWLLQWWLIFFTGITFVRYVSRNDSPKTLKIIIATLTIALITSFGFLIHSQLWQNPNWKDEVGYLADIQGAEEAKRDFAANKLKIFAISGECYEDRFSGTNDGPFEIWTAEYFPSFPYPERYSVEKKVEAYDLCMQSMYKWSLTHTNNTKSSH